MPQQALSAAGRCQVELYANWANRLFLFDLVREIKDRRACEAIDAAVAYVEKCDELFDLATELKLPFDLRCLCNDEAQPNPVVVSRFLDGPGDWSLRLTAGFFHPKVIWFRGAGVYIGSANLTQRAWNDNAEVGVFLAEEELRAAGLDLELQRVFDTIDERCRHAVPAEVLAIEKHRLKWPNRFAALEQKRKQDFDESFSPIPGGVAPSREFKKSKDKSNRRHDAFVREWASTLALLAKHRRTVEQDRVPVRWVPPGTPAAVEVDQVLTWFYEDRIAHQDENVVVTTNRLHEANLGRGDEAFREVLRRWRETTEMKEFIRLTLADWAPQLQMRLSPTKLRTLTVDDLIEIMRRSHAIQDHGYRVRNSVLGLPLTTKLDGHARLEKFAHWLWKQKSAGGHTIADALQYVLWDDAREPLVERLWKAAMCPGSEWAIPDFKVSSFGELLGWARPDEFPPRNNRISRALYALGYADVARYGDS